VTATAWPVEIKYKRADHTLTVTFDDKSHVVLPAEYLRVESPSAEVQGHGPNAKTLVAGKRHVGIARIDPVGRYAVRIVFDDGHDSGLFTWDYLQTLGREHAKRWFEYEARLTAAGLSREP